MCKKNKFKNPVIHKNCVAIACGFLKTAAVITPGGPDNEYVEVGRSTPWLCEAASGVHYKTGPLKRTRLLDTFKVQMQGALLDACKPAESALAAAGKVDKMQLLFANVPAAVVPHRNTRTRGSPEKSGKEDKAEKGKSPKIIKKDLDFTKTLDLPWHFGGTELYGWRLWHKRGSESLWLHIDDLVPAVEHLHSEVENQGVLPMEPDEEDDPALAEHVGSVSWDHRDYYWQVRVRGDKSGTLHRKTFKVSMNNLETGDRLSVDDFLENKESVRLEAYKCMAELEAH